MECRDYSAVALPVLVALTGTSQHYSTVGELGPGRSNVVRADTAKNARRRQLKGTTIDVWT